MYSRIDVQTRAWLATSALIARAALLFKHGRADSQTEKQTQLISQPTPGLCGLGITWVDELVDILMD